MAKKIFTFRGKTLEELQQLSQKEFVELLPTRERRSYRRGFTEDQKSLMQKVESNDKNIKTHARQMIVFPNMVNKMIKVYNGKDFVALTIMPEMIGHRLGEYSITRKRLAHSAPGVGATKSSGAVSVK